MNLVVVEDDAVMSRLLVTQLTRLGHSVVSEFDNAEELVEKFSQIETDLVLLDIELAGEKNGIEAASSLREKSDLPIVFLTSHADKATMQKGKELRNTVYLLKPARLDDLKLVLENFE